MVSAREDNDRLIASLKRCVTWAASSLVEHDEDTMREADYRLTLVGLVFWWKFATGTPKQVCSNKSITGQFVRGNVPFQ